jgi:hypothetical protein
MAEAPALVDCGVNYVLPIILLGAFYQNRRLLMSLLEVNT